MSRAASSRTRGHEPRSTHLFQLCFLNNEERSSSSGKMQNSFRTVVTPSRSDPRTKCAQNRDRMHAWQVSRMPRSRMHYACAVLAPQAEGARKAGPPTRDESEVEILPAAPRPYSDTMDNELSLRIQSGPRLVRWMVVLPSLKQAGSKAPYKRTPVPQHDTCAACT